MTKQHGRFVVFEGIDGAGTTTQAERLYRDMAARRVRAHLTREPTDEPVGRLIREALAGRLVSSRTKKPIQFSERALCLLFAADRVEHSRRIAERRSDGTHVVCDRYVHSSIAYQSLDPDISPEHVVAANAGIAVPDITFFLDVPVEECVRRLKERSDAATVYERADLLASIRRNYEKTRKLYEKKFARVVVIDGSRGADAVQADIAKHLTSILPGA